MTNDKPCTSCGHQHTNTDGTCTCGCQVASMKKISMIVAISVLGLFLATTTVFAAQNPSGTGQPGAECGEEESAMMPHGFTTAGFANAEEHYAGSDGTASLEHSHSAHAVSQYDIACYQHTQNHKSH